MLNKSLNYKVMASNKTPNDQRSEVKPNEWGLHSRSKEPDSPNATQIGGRSAYRSST